MSTVARQRDVDRWLAWKQVSERLRSSVIFDVAEASTVTEPELTVLVQLDQAGGTLRQNALATATGWDRSRLSHLISRMEERGYLDRTRLRNGVEISIQQPGKRILTATQQPLRAAVHRHLASKLDPRQQQALDEILAALSS